MLNFPNDDEIKTYRKTIVCTREPFRKFELDGKPISAEMNTAGREIIIVTDVGYYLFEASDVMSVEFLK